MTYMPVTSFRRPVDAVQLAACRAVDTPLPAVAVDKWQLLRNLAVARRRLGLSDRTLTVLQALLSFHPETELAPGSVLVVYPANASICQRLNGMPSSTMRRHLAALVTAGLIHRRDSPNGKRYARGRGNNREAFGFDLSPLLRRAADIAALADDIRREDEACERLRQRVSLMRRDLAGLVAFGRSESTLPLWDQLGDLASLTARDLRRKLETEELTRLEQRLASALSRARSHLETPEPGSSDAQSEHHDQKSETDISDKKADLKTDAEPASSVSSCQCDDQPSPDAFEPVAVSESCNENAKAVANAPLPLRMVLASCPQISIYAPCPIRHWSDLIRAAETVFPMMGISPTAWTAAREAMGPETAAATLAALLERFADLRSPGGYLRALTAKAEAGIFSIIQMIHALSRQRAAV